jgi:hypothetical protein
MTKADAHEAQQFCSRCHTWGPADTMQPLYRSKDAEAGPWLWMHHHCAEICSSMQFEAAMKRFESQVHSLAAAMTRTADPIDLTAKQRSRSIKRQLQV